MENQEREFIKIKNCVYYLDEFVSAKEACKILDCSYSYLTKETSKRHNRKLKFYKRGNSQTSRLEFKVKDLLEFKSKSLIFHGLEVKRFD